MVPFTQVLQRNTKTKSDPDVFMSRGLATALLKTATLIKRKQGQVVDAFIMSLRVGLSGAEQKSHREKDAEAYCCHI